MASTKWPRTVTVGHASVKVYRIAHHASAGWIYVMAWHTPAGREREKFADPDKALAEARIKAGQLNAGRIEGASMSTGDRDELAAARARAKQAGLPLLAALDELVKARSLVGGNIVPACEAWAARNGKVQVRIKVATALAEYLKAKKAAGRKLADVHGSVYNRVRDDLGELFIDTVSSTQLEAFLANWAHPVTRNTVRRRLVGLFRWAQTKKYLPRDGRTEAEYAQTAVEPPGRPGIIDVTTWRALLVHFDSTHPELMAPLVLAGLAGLRRSEVHGQLWGDINLESGHLRVTTAKPNTPSRRLVPLCPAAVAWLMRCADKSGHVCPLVEYKRKLQPALAIDGIRRIARKAKLPIPENGLRHSYISHAVAESGDIERTSLNAGNSPDEIRDHYLELVTERAGKEWFASGPDSLGEIVPMPQGKAANA